MKKLTSLAAALCLCGWMVGCAPEATDAPADSGAVEHSEEEGGEHAHEEGDDHAHDEEAEAPAETPEAGSST